MKKVWTVSFLVFVMLFGGCEGTDSALSTEETKPAVTASGRSYFWDKDLRPVVAVPAKPAAEPLLPPDVPEPTPRAAMEQVPPAGPVRTAEQAMVPAQPQPDLVTASVEELQPMTPRYGAPAYARPPVMGAGLVSVDGPGGHILSMTYPRPDYGIIQVDKTMPQEVRLNQPFAYAIKVTNLTDMMLTDVVITETISKEFTFKGSEPTALTEGNKLVWEINSLGPRASKGIQITGIAGSARQLEHCTAVTHTIRDCAMVKVVEPALELVKVAPAEALLCEPIPVEFTVTNTGTGAAHNVQIMDTLPAGLQTTDGKSKIVLDAGMLAAGESRRFSVKLRATKKGIYVNKAVAAAGSGLQAESEATLTTVRQPILEITKSGSRRQYLGRPISYEITVINKGDGPARETVVEDIIPPGMTGVEATAGVQFLASKLVWELGTIEANASKTVRVTYTPTQEGEVLATATASAYCAETVTDSRKTIIGTIAAPRLEVIDVEDPLEVGMTTTYIVTVTNEGSAPDSNIRIACTLEDKIQYVSSAGATAGSLLGNTVSFAPLRRLDPRSKAVWRVVARGVRAGDTRFRVTMHTDSLGVPVEQTEATHVYHQYQNGN
jgi:uncharacterized repeat protein (TIGR01451 family)